MWTLDSNATFQDPVFGQTENDAGVKMQPLSTLQAAACTRKAQQSCQSLREALMTQTRLVLESSGANDPRQGPKRLTATRPRFPL